MTTFLVNFRHIFYALSFPLQRVHGRAGKAYSMYALTDDYMSNHWTVDQVRGGWWRL